jgi:cell division protein FtsB
MRVWARAKSLLQQLPVARHRRRVVAGSIALLLLTVVAIFVSRQFAVAGLRRDIARLGVEQAAAEVEQKELRAGVASTSDPATLEEEVRERLGLVKRTEEKVFFVEEKGP